MACGDPLKITQPLSTIERCGVARAFVRAYDLKVPMIVDSIGTVLRVTW